MFFKDGMFEGYLYDYNESRLYSGIQNIPELFKEIAKNDSIGIRSYFYDDLRWGVYVL
jgi:hypothetical protein